MASSPVPSRRRKWPLATPVTSTGNPQSYENPYGLVHEAALLDDGRLRRGRRDTGEGDGEGQCPENPILHLNLLLIGDAATVVYAATKALTRR